MPNLYNSFSTVLLGVFGGEVANGKLDAGAKFVNIAQQFMRVLSRTFFPFLSRKLDKHKVYAQLNIVLSLCMSVLLFFSAPLIIDWIFTEEFAESIIYTGQIQDFINTNIEKHFLKTPWAKFFKSDIIQKNEIKFPYGVKIGEDTLFVLDYLYYTKSIHFLASANYLYYFDKDCIDRYRLSAEKAIEIHHLLIERYKKLNAKSIPFLHYAFIYYYDLISPKDYKSVRRWKNDRIVRQTYKITRHTYTRKWNIKYRFHLLYTIYTNLRSYATKNISNSTRL
jgi:hypothetical protein